MEVAVAEVVGREITQYVANIYRYYVAYWLASEKDCSTSEMSGGENVPRKLVRGHPGQLRV